MVESIFWSNRDKGALVYYVGKIAQEQVVKLQSLLHKIYSAREKIAELTLVS